jgi:two-component system, chemotaxis family, protein-glutamate methylesterase/glutaminase
MSKRFEAIVMGASLGGMTAIGTILMALPRSFSLPIIIVQHISPSSDNYWINSLQKNSLLTIREADEKEKIRGGVVYIAPPNYHLLVERDHTFSLSVDERVSFARPSVDVLFESAATAYGEKLIGIVLTGGNKDGAEGLKKIKEKGGLAIVQDPKTAEAQSMPESAIASTAVDHILSLQSIIELLIKQSNE